ncbi:T9SS type A sorting domain-containing protein [Flaviaesturariibacter aridisoli]|uniref:T9SS type A sorting domain-containing protein n=1 Tax=Flaviaesturariibacter aridisoli TaxID=2545761 RepID=A0A4R4DTN5_9BACT|nr:T9SS type A sorting domain-containing protein [Flaviaesturariibacter aridisoli]TCZ63418.1 T9SS type A sorting domain-containing protein [Flaviaesturariibacter aridisoli]
MKKHLFSILLLILSVCLYAQRGRRAPAPVAAPPTFQLSSANGLPRPLLSRLTQDEPAPDSIAYPGTPYCRDTGSAQPLVTGTPGGSFSATPSGLPIDAATGIINLSTAQAGTYTVTYRAGSSSVTTSVAIRPDSFVAGQPNQVLCAGTAAPATVFDGLPGLAYSWTNAAPAIGLPAAGTGDLPAFTAQNSGTAPLLASIRVQPSGGSGCSIQAFVFRITINPTPTVNAVSNQTVCAGQSTTPVIFTGAVPGTIFSWTNDNSAIGLVAAGTGTIPAFLPLSPNGLPQTATIKVTPRANACNGTPIAFNLSVSPAAGSISYLQASYCPGGRAFVQRTGSGGGQFSAAPSGLNLDAQSGTVNLAASAAGSFTITYSVAAGSGCNATATTSLTVLPRATVNPAPNAVFCNGQASTPVTFSGNASSYRWTNDNPSIGLATGGTGSLPSFVPTGTGTATLRVVPEGGAGTCTGKAMVFRIRVADCSVAPEDSVVVPPGALRTAAITLFPNPTRGLVTVRVEGYSGPLNATLVTSAGFVKKGLLYVRNNTATLDMGGLSAGYYIVQLSDPFTGETVQRSLVRQ